MKENIARGGAITSALTYALCWQLPLVLASFGLGSFTMSMWLIRYRWIFLTATLVLLGFAYYMTYRGPKRAGKWSKRLLHGTAALSLGMIVYRLVLNS